MKKAQIPQQEAIPYLKTLLYIASTDGTLSEEELKYFSIEGTEVGLTAEEIDNAVNWITVKKQSIEYIVKGIVSVEAKTMLISKLLELCLADGDYSIPEKSGIIDICILLDFDLKKLKKLESKAEFDCRMKNNAQKLKTVGDSVKSKFSKAFDASSKGTEQLGKKIADGSSDIAHSMALGIGMVGSKISFTFESAKKAKQENKELRERLQKDSVTEAVKQKVVLQLHSKIQALANQLKEERKRNEQNEEMIRLLQEQIADLEITVVVAENVKTA